jgi:hypothetical protein
MTFIFLLLHADLSHDQILFDIMENGHVNYKIVVNLLNLWDNGHVHGRNDGGFCL